MSSPAAPSKIRLLIVDDHFMVRLGLASALNLEEDMEVIAEGRTGAEAVSLFQSLRPDVVVIDYQLPELNGAEATAAIRAIDRSARVIVLSVFKGEEDVHRAVQAGASGYLPKASEPGELMDAIRAIHAGGTYFPPAINAALETRAGRGQLSDREMQVLEAIVRGRSNKEIAIALGISENTVKVHTTRVFEKLNVADRMEAITAAISRGIVHLA
ncbi:response regulator [Humisphaera borealis]|uniref:Response regulator transcription factor n=1 Tax=Humisphaera borealis TaxID=2807512 RepID=A0A7M2X2Z4_9BACT|nr:response regulator transcription factor [Humisphaera borealis]QOV92147.1 response regulator transcription factor [Humisphaera borealis]